MYRNLILIVFVTVTFSTVLTYSGISEPDNNESQLNQIKLGIHQCYQQIVRAQLIINGTRHIDGACNEVNDIDKLFRKYKKIAKYRSFNTTGTFVKFLNFTLKHVNFKDFIQHHKCVNVEKCVVMHIGERAPKPNDVKSADVKGNRSGGPSFISLLFKPGVRFNFDGDTCKSCQLIKDCVKMESKSCEFSGAVKFINDVLEFLYGRCEKYLTTTTTPKPTRSSTSSLAPASLIAIILAGMLIL